ncbi:DUF3021 family protein [Facklamia sp. 7083-14-GEN3]|uniref:DUF3021 family protein n=1 Tax=Facklamia sp. 7083-14-GEN3 TaxID=2973478 RepID=UPI00215B7A45|nr:DUF3021 family protein [Facklamia sp. 7083-14-GEN3]MCR8969948.1 DUF3021 family protein [Facklamia sp. 7083-14-GEN3]
MFKRAGSFVQYGLLATLLTYGLLTSLGGPQVYTFLSIVILGIILGLLFLIYYAKSLTFGQKLASHIGASALAIIAVALFNGWMQVDWDRVLLVIIILSVLALLAYFGYHYLMNKRKKPQTTIEPEATDRVAPRSDFDPRTGEVLHQEPVVEEKNTPKTNFEKEEPKDIEPRQTMEVEVADPMVLEVTEPNQLEEAETYEEVDPTEETEEVVAVNTDLEGDLVLEEEINSDENNETLNNSEGQEKI